MNILIILATDYPHLGGISSHIETLSKELRHKGDNIFIFTLSSYPLPLRIAFTSFSLFFDTIKKGLGQFLIRIILFELLTEPIIFIYCITRKIEIIHAHDCIAFNSTYLARNLLKIPSVLTVHGYLTLEPIAHGELNRTSYSLIKLFVDQEKKAYKNANHIITVGYNIKKYILKFNLNEFKITNVINFVNINEFNVNYDKSFCRKMFNLNLNKYVILVPRRLVEKCGVMLPLYALQYISEPIKNKLLLVYCGTGPKKKDIETYIRKNNLNNVSLLGRVSHNKMKYIYKASDLVLIPSIPISGVEEATSISALEAMAMGIPIIASNIGGLREIIVNEINGILVQPDSEAFAHAINNFFIGKIKHNKIKSQQYVKDEFIKSIEKIQSIYLKICDEKVVNQ